MRNSALPKARTAGLVVQETADEVLVYDLDANKAHSLNTSSAIVWRSCDGVSTVTDAIAELEAQYGGKVEEDFIWLAIDQLSDKGLMSVDAPAKMAGSTRRDVLKKIGFASVVALPVVASLVAPPNALAAVSCNCSTPVNCPNPRVSCAQVYCDNRGVSASFTCTRDTP